MSEDPQQGSYTRHPALDMSPSSMRRAHRERLAANYKGKASGSLPELKVSLDNARKPAANSGTGGGLFSSITKVLGWGAPKPQEQDDNKNVNVQSKTSGNTKRKENVAANSTYNKYSPPSTPATYSYPHYLGETPMITRMRNNNRYASQLKPFSGSNSHSIDTPSDQELLSPVPLDFSGPQTPRRLESGFLHNSRSRSPSQSLAGSPVQTQTQTEEHDKVDNGHDDNVDDVEISVISAYEAALKKKLEVELQQRNLPLDQVLRKGDLTMNSTNMSGNDTQIFAGVVASTPETSNRRKDQDQEQVPNLNKRKALVLTKSPTNSPSVEPPSKKSKYQSLSTDTSDAASTSKRLFHDIDLPTGTGIEDNIRRLELYLEATLPKKPQPKKPRLPEIPLVIGPAVRLEDLTEDRKRKAGYFSVDFELSDDEDMKQSPKKKARRDVPPDEDEKGALRRKVFEYARSQDFSVPPMDMPHKPLRPLSKKPFENLSGDGNEKGKDKEGSELQSQSQPQATKIEETSQNNQASTFPSAPFRNTFNQTKANENDKAPANNTNSNGNSESQQNKFSFGGVSDKPATDDGSFAQKPSSSPFVFGNLNGHTTEKKDERKAENKDSDKPSIFSKDSSQPAFSGSNAGGSSSTVPKTTSGDGDDAVSTTSSYTVPTNPDPSLSKSNNAPFSFAPGVSSSTGTQKPSPFPSGLGSTANDTKPVSNLFGNNGSENSSSAKPSFTFGESKDKRPEGGLFDSAATSQKPEGSQDKQTDKPLFGFGKPTENENSAEKKDNDKPSLSAKSDSKPSFTFGKPAEKNDANPVSLFRGSDNKPSGGAFGASGASSAFGAGSTFGAQPSTTTPFTFGGPKTEASKTEASGSAEPEPKPVASAFSGFGSANNKEFGSSASGTISSTSDKPAASSTLNGSGESSAKPTTASGNNSNTTTSIFGADTKKSPFAFGQASQSSAPTFCSSSSANDTTKSNGFSFGSTSVGTATETSAPAGKRKADETEDTESFKKNTNETKPAFVFGSTGSALGSANANANTGTGTGTSSASLFGSASNGGSGGIFGSASTASSASQPSTGAGIFGSSATTTASNNGGGLFATASNGSTGTTSNAFGSSATAGTQPSNPFGFASSSGATQPSNPFGSASTGTTGASNSGFNFNANLNSGSSSSSSSSSGGGLFGAGNSGNANSLAPAAAPSSGPTKAFTLNKPTFSFSSNANVDPLKMFGHSSQPGSAQPTPSPGFTPPPQAAPTPFGQAQAPGQASAPATYFGQTQQSAQPMFGQFNPSANGLPALGGPSSIVNVFQPSSSTGNMFAPSQSSGGPRPTGPGGRPVIPLRRRRPAGGGNR